APAAGAVPAATPSPSPSRTEFTPSGPAHLVGLGDSVMAGTNCDCDGIVAGLADSLQSAWKVPVSQVNLGESGATTDDLLDDLTNDPRTMSEVGRADVVLVIIGANDLTDDLDTWRRTGCERSCYQPHVRQMQSRLAKILARIANLEGTRPYTLVVDGYWNILTDGQTALQQGGWPQLSWSRAVTAAVDAAIQDAAGAAGARYVELRPVFADTADRLLADDGDHPNAAGVAAIVRANLRALRG
ncbi:MAG: SGNH/GDSL hydrolase family protein, partial [Micropruina sp.]|uniref:SGNH/GDSL hydrolase family protein n=1 Tax=Micropruina sp. TaxID=2737536 RepID=UPI0039E5C2FC